MDVSATGAASTTAATQTLDSTSAAANALTGDFDTFLRLLTAQMRNQDPLEPTNNTEFVAQLASFSSVEQQVQANTALQSINRALSGADAQSLASWIGREVLSEGQAVYAGEAIEMEIIPVSNTDRTELVVRDSIGQLAARVPVSAVDGKVNWNGMDANGNPLPHGVYSFEVESFDDELMLGSQPGLIFTEVSEVRVVDGEAELVLASGARISSAEVKAVR